MALASTPGFAQSPKVSSEKPVSPSATVNLIRLLIKQGLLTEDQAAALIKQAEEETYVAREAIRSASDKAQEAGKAATAAAEAVSPPGTKRVTYVPEIVKRELREQLRAEVIEKAKQERWLAPNTLPDWASHIRFSGDVRAIYEGVFFPRGNANTAGPNQWNFSAINTGVPFDTNPLTNPTTPPPLRDVDQNRTWWRLRARFGIEADLFDGFTAGLRVATGDNSFPVSTYETLGGGPGNFSKSPAWVDRAFVSYTAWDTVRVQVGRFDNPFYAPTDLVWYSEIAMDGAAVQAAYEILPNITPFAVVGAFPLFNTAVNFPTNGAGILDPFAEGANLPSGDKYLYAGQVGLGWKLDPKIILKFGAAYYDFAGVQGKLSSLCDASNINNVCDTDLFRNGYGQFGNSYMALRNALQTDLNGNPLPTFQFFGLASAFRVLDLTGRLDLAQFDPVHVLLDGTYVKNLAFNRSQVAQVALNNNINLPDPNGFVGGNMGAMARLTVGYPEIKQLWDWNVYGAYKYLQSDAVMDAFTDPDFGLGGTNLKGYIVGANLGIGPNIWMMLKWMSANSISGFPYAVDVLQAGVNARF